MTDRQGLQAVASVSLGEGGPLGACPWNHRLPAAHLSTIDITDGVRDESHKN